MLLNPSSCTNQSSSTGPAAILSNSNSHQPTKQWREALQPMMKNIMTNPTPTQKERGVSETSQKTYNMGANSSLAQNMTISLAPHNTDSKHVNNLRLSGQFTTSLAHNEKSQTNLLHMAKSSPMTSSTNSKNRTPYMNSTSHK